MTDTGKTADKNDKTKADVEKKATAEVSKPDWADGLKQFYDSVVDEPLPDELSKLLSQFDGGEEE